MKDLLAATLLIPDVSRSSPELYKAKLFQVFGQDTRFGRAAFDFITAHRDVSPDKITLNPNTWKSGHDEKEGIIMLGTSDMTPEERALNFPFETNSFTDQKIMQHKFAHEIAHFLGEALADQITSGDNTIALQQYERLIRSFANFRRDPSNRGMTSHAGDERYVRKGPDIQAVEDMTDLMAYYLVDPQYLERYLQYLSDPQYEEQREKYKLQTLSQQAADLIRRNIATVIDLLLTVPNGK